MGKRQVSPGVLEGISWRSTLVFDTGDRQPRGFAQTSFVDFTIFLDGKGFWGKDERIERELRFLGRIKNELRGKTRLEWVAKDYFSLEILSGGVCSGFRGRLRLFVRRLEGKAISSKVQAASSPPVHSRAAKKGGKY